MADIVEVYLTMICPAIPGVDRTEVRVSSSDGEGVREAVPWLHKVDFWY